MLRSNYTLKRGHFFSCLFFSSAFVDPEACFLLLLLISSFLAALAAKWVFILQINIIKKHYQMATPYTNEVVLEMATADHDVEHFDSGSDEELEFNNYNE